MVTKSALVLLAEGAEEMEFAISVDILRRAGIAVTIAGLSGTGPVKCSRDVVVCPDTSLQDAVKKAPYDVIVLPGGMQGARNLAASSEVGFVLRKQEKEHRLLAAIGAAPLVLRAHHVCFRKSLTSFPLFKEELQEKYEYKEDSLVVEGNLVTSQGPATAFDFALTIVETLLGTRIHVPFDRIESLKNSP